MFPFICVSFVVNYYMIDYIKRFHNYFRIKNRVIKVILQIGVALLFRIIYNLFQSYLLIFGITIKPIANT